MKLKTLRVLSIIIGLINAHIKLSKLTKLKSYTKLISPIKFK
jgi:hypothetical protein